MASIVINLCRYNVLFVVSVALYCVMRCKEVMTCSSAYNCRYMYDLCSLAVHVAKNINATDILLFLYDVLMGATTRTLSLVWLVLLYYINETRETSLSLVCLVLLYYINETRETSLTILKLSTLQFKIVCRQHN